ncbi:MAG: SIR2 family protein [Pseudomonadota bacterium]
MRYPSRLVEATSLKKMVPFIGAGVSKFAAPNLFPTWAEFISNFLAKAKADGHLPDHDFRDLSRLAAAGKSLTVAEHLKEVLPSDYYIDVLIETFDIILDEEADLSIYEILFEMNPPIMITTNYDRLIEDSYARLKRRNMDVKTHQESVGVIKALQRTRNNGYQTLFKIHGDVRTPSNVVLSEKDYRNVMYDLSDYRMAMDSIFSLYTVLFIGFSMGDKEMISTIENLRHTFRYLESPHYILLREGETSHVERRRWREDFGLEVIEYTRGDDHRGLLHWFRDFSAESG